MQCRRQLLTFERAISPAHTELRVWASRYLHCVVAGLRRNGGVTRSQFSSVRFLYTCVQYNLVWMYDSNATVPLRFHGRANRACEPQVRTAIVLYAGCCPQGVRHVSTRCKERRYFCRRATRSTQSLTRSLRPSSLDRVGDLTENLERIAVVRSQPNA